MVTWTDIVQSIAAIIAALGAVAAFWKLFSENKQQREQLEHQQKQINELARQSELMNEHNQLNKRRLDLSVNPSFEVDSDFHYKKNTLEVRLRNNGNTVTYKNAELLTEHEGRVKFTPGFHEFVKPNMLWVLESDNFPSRELTKRFEIFIEFQDKEYSQHHFLLKWNKENPDEIEVKPVVNKKAAIKEITH